MESERIVYSFTQQDPSQGSYGSIERSFTGSLLTSAGQRKRNPVNQSIYLTELSEDFAEVLGGLIGDEARSLIAVAEACAVVESDKIVTGDELDVWESRIEQQIETDPSVNETDREAIVRAGRRGQGLFKQRVMRIETHCRITGVDNPSYLLASHCKPWRDSSNEERLSGENSLLLTPSIDHLFDRGFIGFEDSGNLIISPVAHKPSLQGWASKRSGSPTSAPLLTASDNFFSFTATPFC